MFDWPLTPPKQVTLWGSRTFLCRRRATLPERCRQGSLNILATPASSTT